MGKMRKLVGLAATGALVAAVVTELRKPEEQRTWEGTLGGVIPYDLRPPTLERLQERVWAPEDETLFPPHFYGVGWSVNVGRIARRLGFV